ncbi:MAG: sn-glycerol-1-phosphate dehydrogenase [Pseudomonadota bacterium]
MDTYERQKLLGSKWECECGTTHDVPVREAIIEPGAIDGLPDVMRRQNLSGPVFLIADENTHHVAGEKVASRLGKAGFKVIPHVLKGRPIAYVSQADEVASSVPGDAATIISCGSGTITDFGKWSAFKKGLPFVAVATAPSMNGYASGIAALVKDGLKATTPVKPAVAVIADLDVLCQAPMDMIRSGLGDVLSKPVCNADWRLATLVRGGTFCKRPFELIRDLEDTYISRAHLIADRDPEAIRALTEALVFSGISMLMAGSSSPASGGEHLISHVLDMRAYEKGKIPEFHGVQVGVGTVATARLYEMIMNTEADSIDRSALQSVWERGEEALARCRNFFGKAAPAIETEFRKKHASKRGVSEETIKIINEWERIKDAVSPYLRSPKDIRDILKAAGAKSSYDDLGIKQPVFREILLLAVCVRNRYTVLDLAFTAGLLDVWADAMVAEK